MAKPEVVNENELPSPDGAEDVERARVAERELEFLTLLREMVGRLMDAYRVDSVADLPHASHLVGRAVEECAVAKNISEETAVELARRDLGLPR